MFVLLKVAILLSPPSLRSSRSKIWLSDLTYSKELGITNSSLVLGFLSIAARDRLKMTGEKLLSNQASLISNITVLIILVLLSISSSNFLEKQSQINEYLMGRNTSALWPWTDPNKDQNVNPFEPIGTAETVTVDSKTAKVIP